jgi:hypothetical protein
MADEPNYQPAFAEVFTPMQQMAILLHETYSAFLSAGFDEQQSIELACRVADFAPSVDDDEDYND